MFFFVPKEEEKCSGQKSWVLMIFTWLVTRQESHFFPPKKKIWLVSEELVDKNRLWKKNVPWQDYNSGFSVFAACSLSWSSWTNKCAVLTLWQQQVALQQVNATQDEDDIMYEDNDWVSTSGCAVLTQIQMLWRCKHEVNMWRKNVDHPYKKREAAKSVYVCREQTFTFTLFSNRSWETDSPALSCGRADNIHMVSICS